MHFPHIPYPFFILLPSFPLFLNSPSRLYPPPIRLPPYSYPLLSLYQTSLSLPLPPSKASSRPDLHTTALGDGADLLPLIGRLSVARTAYPNTLTVQGFTTQPYTWWFGWGFIGPAAAAAAALFVLS